MTRLLRRRWFVLAMMISSEPAALKVCDVADLKVCPTYLGLTLTQQPRSVAPPSASTATLTGIVVSAGQTPVPLRRAIVTVRGGQGQPARSAITDDDGRFVIARLAAGRVTIAATKPGYVAGTYGALRPGRPGTSVSIAAGQTFDAKVVLSRAAVMTGVVRDERGQPLPDVRLYAIDVRRPAVPSAARPPTGMNVTTDDRGVFRLFDLVPGEYVIAAVPPSNYLDTMRRSEAEVDRQLARLRNRNARGASPPATATADRGVPATLAPIYFPASATLLDAQHVTVSAGEVREGIDITMALVPVTTIEGALAVDSGPLPDNVQIFIRPDTSLQVPGLAPTLRVQQFNDGTFEVAQVPPGHYVISARSDRRTTAIASPSAPLPAGMPPPPPPPPTRGYGPASSADTMYALEEIDVNGTSISTLTLRLRQGATITGRVQFDAGTTAAPFDLRSLQVGLQVPQQPGFNPTGIAWSQAASVRADGTFQFAGVAPGRYTVQAVLAPSQAATWFLRAAIVGDRDVLDTGLDLPLGSDLSATLTLTDRRTELSGMLQTAAGQAATEYFVIVMPADPALRLKGSRRIKMTRPASDGRFVLSDLPAGDYLIVALTDVEPDEWQDPDFLAPLARLGVPISIADGEKKVQILKIG